MIKRTRYNMCQANAAGRQATIHCQQNATTAVEDTHTRAAGKRARHGGNAVTSAGKLITSPTAVNRQAHEWANNETNSGSINIKGGKSSDYQIHAKQYTGRIHAKQYTWSCSQNVDSESSSDEYHVFGLNTDSTDESADPNNDSKYVNKVLHYKPPKFEVFIENCPVVATADTGLTRTS